MKPALTVKLADKNKRILSQTRYEIKILRSQRSPFELQLGDVSTTHLI